MDASALTFQFYGGKLSESIDESVSHIVLDPTDLTRLAEIRECLKGYLSPPLIFNVHKSLNRLLYVNPRFAKHVVTKEWIEESAAAHEDLDEREFYIVGDQSASSASATE